MRELEKEGKVKFHVASVKAMHGEPGKLTGVTLAGADKSEWHHETDAFLPFFGLTIKLGPIAEFGINLHENLIPVDTARFESQTPGIFAIGDINTYTGKLKLILSGFHEAALMAQAAFHICQAEREAALPVHDLVVQPAKEIGCLVKIIAIDRQGKEHTLEGRDGWSVMEILRDGGPGHRGGMRRRLRLRHLPCLCRMTAGTRSCPRRRKPKSTCWTWRWRSSPIRACPARSSAATPPTASRSLSRLSKRNGLAPGLIQKTHFRARPLRCSCLGPFNHSGRWPRMRTRKLSGKSASTATNIRAKVWERGPTWPRSRGASSASMTQSRAGCSR